MAPNSDLACPLAGCTISLRITYTLPSQHKTRWECTRSRGERRHHSHSNNALASHVMSPQARFNFVRATTRSILPMKICIYSPPFVDLDAEILLQEVDEGWSYRRAFSWRRREMFVPRHELAEGRAAGACKALTLVPS